MKTPLEIARQLAEYQQTEDAQRAYTLFLQQEDARKPEEELEAATYLFFSQADYKLPYTTFVSLFRRGFFQAELLELMSQAFYFPNLDMLKKRYETNCRQLSSYPYCFRKDFPAFEDLPIWFFPFDEKGYLPYFAAESRFGDYVDFNDPVIDRYFFQDLENPILAQDVYSQYQLEYLNDTVRKSEWVAKDNHIYLHYTDWNTFCAYLQCLDFRKLLHEKKFVFLMEDEVQQYPLDFKVQFDIDYSQYPIKPVGAREVNRLIWHTQLSTHNGGDFFNEIFYGHPNLLAYESLMFDNIQETISAMKQTIRNGKNYEAGIRRYLIHIKHPTDKDLLVAFFLGKAESSSALDPNSRIAPILFFQPHFPNINYTVRVSSELGGCVLSSQQYDKIRTSSLFNQFKYIKTFVPIRRITTSYGASTKFALKIIAEESDESTIPLYLPDQMSHRVLNRSYRGDRHDRLYRDSVLVRFEDGKLNPKATFTALAEFLDIPYTESMTYCSGTTGINHESLPGNDLGFSPAAIYRTYDDYADDAARAYLEYFMRDAYKAYGYDFHYYKGEPVNETWIEEKSRSTPILDRFMSENFENFIRYDIHQKGKNEENAEELVQAAVKKYIEDSHQNRIAIAKMLQQNLPFVNSDGQPLPLIPLLKLDPDLLEQPLYR